MKRKKKLFERNLKDNILRNLCKLFPNGQFSQVEQILVDKIKDGDIDVSKGKKGRKRNYQNFFQDDFLQEFVNPSNLVKTPVKTQKFEIKEQDVASCSK